MTLTRAWGTCPACGATGTAPCGTFTGTACTEPDSTVPLHRPGAPFVHGVRPLNPEVRMTRKTPAAEQFAALGLSDTADWSPVMELAVKQRWSGLPIDRKVDELRADLAAVVTAPTPTASELHADPAFLPHVAKGPAGAATEPRMAAAILEAKRLSRNAKVNAWRERNQIQAALDARAAKFARMRAGKAGIRIKATSGDAVVDHADAAEAADSAADLVSA